MAQAMENQQKTQKGRGGGLLMVWRREPVRRPGVDKETYSDIGCRAIESTRTWYHQTGPRTEEASQKGPTTWPRCLGRVPQPAALDLHCQPH